MLVSFGLDFRSARLEARERFHVDDAQVPRVLGDLEAAGVHEVVMARTCNRVETYCWWPEGGGASDVPERARAIGSAWLGGDGEELGTLMELAHTRTSGNAARHLFRVAAGLESQILGDVHILGQLRRAYRDAVEAERVGSHLHRLFETAFRVGKQVQRETALKAVRSGVGLEAARRAVEHWGSLRGLSCVVLGCGKSGSHAARWLSEHGATDLTVLNRTVERAETLARRLGNASAAGLDALPGLLSGAHVIVVATGASEPVLEASMLGSARASGADGVLVIDVSVPRNADPAVAGLPGVELIDLDALSPEAAEQRRSRVAAVPEAEAIVEEGVLEFVGWLELAVARKALRPLQAVLAEICQREVAYATGESRRARETAERIVARLMAHPMTALRSAAERGEYAAEAVAALGALFAGPEADGGSAPPPGSPGVR
jgi:glutamyl-tRNA reductase